MAHASGWRSSRKRTTTAAHAFTLIPGRDLSGSPISRVELLLEDNQDTAAGSNGITAHESKVFVRLRHDGDLSGRVGYYIRGGIGHSNNSERDYNFAYIEPGMEYKLGEKWAWTLAYREINAIDGTPGQHVGKIYFGPSFDMDKNNEFEFRLVKGSGDKNLTSGVFEYVHKY